MTKPIELGFYWIKWINGWRLGQLRREGWHVWTDKGVVFRSDDQFVVEIWPHIIAPPPTDSGADLKQQGLTIRNPAPDASPPSVPSGTYRDVRITWRHSSGTT
jgi:hypothetical protein